MPQLLLIQVSDQGPGIRNLREILEGRYRSRTGMGLGILGARRLMDQFSIDSEPGRGTRIALRKLLPRTARLVDGLAAARIADELVARPPRSALEEVQQQNQELLRTMDELRARQDELLLLNRELEDTNRGVVALYAELDEKADHLRRADELKSRFLSNMSHEFRTPVNSILALSRLLLDRLDGPLSPEQDRQVAFIRKAARGPHRDRQRPARPRQGGGGQGRGAPDRVHGGEPVRRPARHAAPAARQRPRGAVVRGGRRTCPCS